MSIKFTKPYFSPDARKEILIEIEEILSSGQLMLGNNTNRFETSFADYIKTSKAVTTNSCTTALQISLMHYDVRGFEVLLPGASFITNISSVKWAGGIPVLVDIDPETLSFNLDDLKRKLTAKTKGIVWVHLTGLITPAWREIIAFAREHGLFLIEDCAHAHGASVDGIKAGSLGDVGCFSFYPTKVMTTGTGGIITTNDLALEKTARELRLFGREGGVGAVVREGNDWFMDEIRACLGYHQLKELDSALLRRREIAQYYKKKLTGIPGLSFLNIPKDNVPTWYLYTVFVAPDVDYKKLTKKLEENHGIPTKPIYLPLHQENIFRDFDNGTLSNSETTLNRSLCLPIHVEMDNYQVDQVVRALWTELLSMK
ncbi:MAG: DegT/DnrJ/EryC1/StrS family aminotransferase [Betaproteobacteria bacterium]|nr:DegT/DnrJ/EryC1/StrS family aminotransferase [Betaproteobacteria bacterium]